MTHHDWADPPYAVLVNGDPGKAAAAATAGGALVRSMSLAGLHDDREICERAKEVFEIPHPVGGLAGLTGWLADLEWLADQRGALLIFDAREAVDVVVMAIASLLPGVAERRRTGSRPFAAHLVDVAQVGVVRDALTEANRRLDEFAALPWTTNATGAVPIVYP